MENSELGLFPKMESREIQHYQEKIEELDRYLVAAIGKQGELKLEIEALNKRIKRQKELLEYGIQSRDKAWDDLAKASDRYLKYRAIYRKAIFSVAVIVSYCTFVLTKAFIG